MQEFLAQDLGEVLGFRVKEISKVDLILERGLSL